MSAIWLIIGALGAGALVWLMMRSRLGAALVENKEVSQQRDEARRTIAERERQLAEVRGDLQTQVARLTAELQGERGATAEDPPAGGNKASADRHDQGLLR